MKIAIPLFDRFTALDAVGPYEVLSRLPGASVHFVAAEPGSYRTENRMLTLVAEKSIADVDPPDILLVPADGVPSALYLVEVAAPGVHRTPLVSLDMTRQLCDITLDDAPARQVAVGVAAEAAVSAGLAAGAAVLAAEQLGLA